MEPEDGDFMPDGDDFVMETCWMDKYHLCMYFFRKQSGKRLLTKLLPFSIVPLFVAMTEVHSVTQKQTLQV